MILVKLKKAVDGVSPVCLPSDARWDGAKAHMGRGGDSPPLRVKSPPPTLRPKIGYLQRKFLILPPSEAKIQAFLTKFY